MTEKNLDIKNIVDTSSDILNAAAEVSKDTSMKTVSDLINSLLGKEKEKIETHLYLKNLQEKVENKGSGNIHIPKVSKIKRDAEYIHIPDVMQSVLELLSNIAPGAKSIVNITNHLITMLIGEDVKGVGFFLTKESQQVIKSNSYEDLVIARTAVEEDLTALRSIETDHDKWEDKMKLSILYTAFDRAIFEKNEENKENTEGKEGKEDKEGEKNTENFSKKSNIDKKIEYLESTLKAGDILYLNEPNQKKSWMKNLTVNLAKPAMIDAKNSKDFTSIHAAVYTGNGKIRHIQRGNDGKISKKELSIREFFTENEDNETVYASIVVGRLNLSKPVQNIFTTTVIEKSEETTEYSELEAVNAGVHGLFNSATDLQTDDTNLICTDLPRMSALRILENIDKDNVITIDSSGKIVRKQEKQKINSEDKEVVEADKGVEEIEEVVEAENTKKYKFIKLTALDISELKKLANSNGTFQMFTNLAAPLAMNVEDFTIAETTKKMENKKIETGDVSETTEITKQ